MASQKNIFRGYENPQASRPRNAFDLSHKSIFSAKAGMLMPVHVEETVPGDHFEVNYNYLVRTLPLNNAAFLNCKIYLHTFFVPYSAMWRQWNSFIAQRNDPRSTAARGFSYVPHFNLASLGTHIQNLIRSSSENDRARGAGAFRLQEMLGFGLPWYTGPDSIVDADYSFFKDINPSIFRAAAYQMIWYDHYRNPYFDIDVDPYYFNFDDLQCDSFSTSDIGTLTPQRAMTLDKYFTPRYRQWNKDLFLSLMPSTQFGNISQISVDTDLVLDKATLEYHFGDLSSSSKASRPLMVANSGGVVSPSTSSGATATYDNPNFTITGQTTSGLFNVLQLRRAEAVQKWRELTLRAGQRSRNQQMAHFGVAPMFDEDTRSVYLGGTDSWLNIDDVTATADSPESDNDMYSSIVGSQRGRAIAVDSPNKVVFDAKDFGVMMTLCSIVPEVPYTSHRIDKNNMLSEPFDFFTPEFENLGLEPVLVAESSTAYPSSIFNNLDDLRVLGYAPRYYNYKARADRVYGEFNKYSNLINNQQSGIFENVVGSLRQFTPSRESVNLNPRVIGSGLRAEDFYVQPNCLDDIFVLTSDYRELSDQFFFNLNINCKAVRPMSVLGLPNY